jgi:hypothetical protein
MKSPRFRSILIVLGVLLLAGLCYIMVSPGDTPAPEEIAPFDYEPTSTFAPTTTPALVSFDSVCQAQREILVEGFLHVPDSVGCAAEADGEFCTVQLTDLVTRTELLLSLPVDGEREAPVPHHMLALPIPYDNSDFMVASDDNHWVGEGSIVRVTGQADPLGYEPSEGYDCRLANISKVEKLEHFSLVNDQTQQITLRTAVQEGWVEISITGDGLSSIDLKIEPKVNFNVDLEIEAGTVFLSDAAGVQNMVVRKQSFVHATPELEAEIELEVSCANMSKKQPGKENTFTVLPDLAPEDLINLIDLADFAFEPMRIQQFSIWTITDNPSRDGYVGLTSSFSSEGSGPTDDELARIKELFLMANLDITKYNVLQE